LSTNGKPDASIQFLPGEPYTTDEITMVIAGALPLAYMPDARHVANIGMGSGLTTHVMLAHEGIKQIDTIEIEAAMVAAATGYGEFVERAYSDRRSKIHIEDAKTFFSLHNNVYDIIVAEPSNPWVSGVASLFSSEFYRTVQNYLTDDGLFVQWIQLYEFNDQLAESILKALNENFSDYVVYTTDGSNILLIAKNRGDLPEPDWSVLFESGIADDLARLDVRSANDMLVRKLIERDSLVPHLNRSPIPANSDYFPFVDLNAGQARFKGSQANTFISMMNPPLPVAEMLSGDRVDYADVTDVPFLTRVTEHKNATWVYRRLVQGASLDELGDVGEHLRLGTTHLTDLLRTAMKSCDMDFDASRFRFTVHNVLSQSLPYLGPDEGVSLVNIISNADCDAQKEAESLLWFDLYRAVARRDAAAMSIVSRQLLASETEASEVVTAYLLTAAMLGDVVSGNLEEARLVWNQYAETAFVSMSVPGFVEVLSGIAMGQEHGVVARSEGAIPD
jgi:hypothetical protein